MQFELSTLTQFSITITLQFCKGRLGLMVSKNPVTYASDPTIVIQYSKDKYIVKINEPNGRYYIKVTGIPGDCFELFTDVNQVSFTMEAKGEIQYFESKGQYKLNWPAPLINGKPSDQSLQYYLYYSDHYLDELNSACAMRLAHKNGLLTFGGEFTETHAGISSSKSLYVNIIGFFSRHREEPQGFVVYDPIELKHSNIEDGKDYSII